MLDWMCGKNWEKTENLSLCLFPQSIYIYTSAALLGAFLGVLVLSARGFFLWFIFFPADHLNVTCKPMQIIICWEGFSCCDSGKAWQGEAGVPWAPTQSLGHIVPSVRRHTVAGIWRMWYELAATTHSTDDLVVLATDERLELLCEFGKVVWLPLGSLT